VGGDGVAGLPLDLVDHGFELGIGKRLDLAAVVADEVVMMLAALQRRFVARDSGTEVDPLDEALLGELLEHAIDACNPDAAPVGTQLVEDLLRGQAAVLPTEELDDRAAGAASPAPALERCQCLLGPGGHGSIIAQVIVGMSIVTLS